MNVLSRFTRAFGRLGPLSKAVAIIAAGVLGLVLLIVLRPRPAAQEPPRRVPLVVTAPAQVRSGNLTVRGNGTVRPKSEIVLSPQVAGKVEWVSPGFASGGRFTKGDRLLQIEAADYENAVQAAEAEVAQRQVEVMQWEEERTLSMEEYERLRAREGIDAPPDSSALGRLVFREPQLKAAEASLARARAGLEDARLRLQRTRITAPFDGVMRSKSVDVGQYVAPGQNLGTLYEAGEVEIVVPLTDTEATLVDGLWKAESGDETTRIPATVTATFGGRAHTWPAYVDRAEGALNPETRTVDAVVRVPDPFATDESGRPPLLLGTYATVDIQGASQDAFAVLPRTALRDGSSIWVIVHDTTLVIRPATQLQEIGSEVFLAVAVAPGEPVVVSPLDVVTDSMTVQVATGGAR